jgi:hypothetical protein
MFFGWLKGRSPFVSPAGENFHFWAFPEMSRAYPLRALQGLENNG